eukprot:56516-Eustigmatos_ZCMA.PRE.1
MILKGLRILRRTHSHPSLFVQRGAGAPASLPCYHHVLPAGGAAASCPGAGVGPDDRLRQYRHTGQGTGNQVRTVFPLSSSLPRYNNGASSVVISICIVQVGVLRTDCLGHT